MMARMADDAAGPNVRSVAVVYLLYFPTALLAGFLMKGLVVPGNAAATATNILAHEALYRSGLAVDLAANALYIAVTALFYWLFAPVNRRISLMAAFFSLVGCGVQIFAGIFRLAPLVMLRDSHLSSTFGTEQLQAIALLSLTLHGGTINIALVLFALYDLLLGYLIYRSTFLPRALGIVMMIAGVGWLTCLWPPLVTALASIIVPLGGLAEIALLLWLLIRGVDVSRWREMAGSV
jgi:Domain of unknown function (DUF4386)